MTAIIGDLPTRRWLPRHDDPAIASEWVVTGYTGPIACYGASVWSLAPLSDNPSASRESIHWEVFPADTREEFRLLAWSLINGTLPRSFLRQRSPGWRARVCGGKVYATLWWWRTLARWLDQQGITTLAATSPGLFADFAASVKDKGRSRSHVAAALTALTRLWAFDQVSPLPREVPEPLWVKEGVDDYLPAATKTGENSTDPITEATMGPLLIWAMRMVDDFADDILAAWGERQRLRSAAQQNVATPASLTALKDFLDPLVDGRPFPASVVSGRIVCAGNYIAGITGASLDQVANLLYRRRHMREYVRQYPGPCPLGVPITGTLEGAPWRTPIDYNEAAALMRHLGTACFIVIAYLTGMRPGEVLGLRTGCCPDTEEGRHLIRGNVYKTARDDDGHHLSSGELRDVPWVAIAPVVNAIRVLERCVPEGSLLFDQRIHDLLSSRAGTGSLAVNTMRGRVEDFVSWANEETARLNRPGDVIQPDPHGNLGTGRFRRTLAWHIARRPGGLVALAIQYGHMRTSVSVGYASRSRDGIHDLLDVETARATIDTVAGLHADLEDGAGVSGPAARRAIDAAAQAPRFVGTVVSLRQARKVLANPDLAVHDNPHAFLMCVYKRDKALCHRDGIKDAPRLDHCVSACANISRTDRQADQLQQRAAELELKARHVPGELAKRLRANASRMRDAAGRHLQTRITLKEDDQ
ncbi:MULTISPECIES: integrase [unclassified Streptomyces]|uniref:integrase n=1 Tax=unclassified Streptomyces TaxID=2593676 RepID=UPI002ED20D8F|nr:site-specific integrase [Streptomyces sp. NBC_00891]WSY05400.1 site-specific integrase [Streptomyces sp. NBC_00890]WSZ07024.1 site-specific integrase [Streptomyces sp. NBC_00869]WSZ25478.1 site-specific integrase [Streptomyces sp. NBC_00870]